MPKGILALDLDGTLLNSAKELSARSRAALEKAAAAGYEIVPTTGRFYDAMPSVVRELPFVRYAVTVNGAQVEDRREARVLYRAELPWERAVALLAELDGYGVIYDCYQDNAAFMADSHKAQIDRVVATPYFRQMLHELRQGVPELKAFLTERRRGVQKLMLYTAEPALRAALLERFSREEDLAVSSSIAENIELNERYANKGEALLALAAALGLTREQCFAFGDGLNDVSMLRAAGTGFAMENASAAVKAAADRCLPSCDADGVAVGIEEILSEKEGVIL